MYDRIVVPLDGSELAETALPFAELIPSRDVRLFAVEPAAGAQPPAPERWRGTTPADYLAAVAAPLERQGRSVECVVEAGAPAEQIVTAAGDADLIVMATRGLGQREGARVGSVADEVARRAPVPTLLIRGKDLVGPPAIARLVVPLDGSPRAEAALPAAARLAGLLGLRVHLIQAVDVAANPGAAADRERAAAAYLAAQTRRLGVLRHRRDERNASRRRCRRAPDGDRADGPRRDDAAWPLRVGPGSARERRPAVGARGGRVGLARPRRADARQTEGFTG